MKFYGKALALMFLGTAMFSAPGYIRKERPIKNKDTAAQEYETRHGAKVPIVYGYGIDSLYVDRGVAKCGSESVAAFCNPETDEPEKILVTRGENTLELSPGDEMFNKYGMRFRLRNLERQLHEKSDAVFKIEKSLPVPTPR